MVNFVMLIGNCVASFINKYLVLKNVTNSQIKISLYSSVVK